MSQSARGAGLEDYLKRLSYEPVAFKEGSQPLVQGQLGNNKSVTFAVDTGWGLTTLDPAKAAGLKTLGEIGTVLEDSFLGEITNGSIAVINTLMLGRAQFMNQPARVSELKMDYKTVSFQGVLGLDFLFRNFCLIDCRDRRIYVRGSAPSEQQTAALKESLTVSGFTEVPLRPLIQHGLCIEAEVNGEPVILMVDTGATFSTLDDAQLKRLGLSTVKWDQPATGTLIRKDMSAFAVGVGEIGSHTMRVATLNSLQLGARKLNNAHFAVVNLRSWGMAKSGTPLEGVQGLLGFDVLANYGVLIDVAGKRLWFRPDKSEKR